MDGLGRYVGESWDLVLTDRNMPGMSGDALAAAIKRIHPRVPIILVTNYADYGSSGVRSESPFDLTLRKPFNGETIRAAVSALCTARGDRLT
jgi:CheY-like chemotaxis protein